MNGVGGQPLVWTLHEHIDCKDPYNKWLDAIVIDLKYHDSNGEEGTSLDQVSGSAPLVDLKVSYTDFSDKYNEWIDAKSVPERVLKQWGAQKVVPGKQEKSDIGDHQLDYNQLRVNNRIDVYDRSKEKWREARVIQIERNSQN